MNYVKDKTPWWSDKEKALKRFRIFLATVVFEFIQHIIVSWFQTIFSFEQCIEKYSDFVLCMHKSSVRIFPIDHTGFQIIIFLLISENSLQKLWTMFLNVLFYVK